MIKRTHTEQARDIARPLPVAESEGERVAAPLAAPVQPGKAQSIPDNLWRGTISSDGFEGGAEDNAAAGFSGDDDLYGRDGNDWLEGGIGGDELFGGSGNDTLWGGTGWDSLRGESGADTFIYVKGDHGDTILDFNVAEGDIIKLYGFAGQDTLTGGAGADVFVIGLGDGANTIADFQDGIDRIDLSAFGGYASIGQLAAGAKVVFADGSYVILTGVQASSLSAADFIGLPAPMPADPPKDGWLL